MLAESAIGCAARITVFHGFSNVPGWSSSPSGLTKTKPALPTATSNDCSAVRPAESVTATVTEAVRLVIGAFHAIAPVASFMLMPSGEARSENR